MTTPFKRIANLSIKRKLKTSHVIVIEGPLACGKNTTSMQFAKSSCDLTNEVAAYNTKLMLDIEFKRALEGQSPKLFREWQLVPDLLNAPQKLFDDKNVKCKSKFIFTESVALQADKSDVCCKLDNVSKIRMRPLSLFESSDSSGKVSLAALFANKDVKAKNKLTKEDLAYLICRGGFPKACTDKENGKKKALRFAFDYIKNVIISSQCTKTNTIKDPQRLLMILNAYARHIATTASLETIRAQILSNFHDTTYSQTTLYAYLQGLNDLFLTEENLLWNTSLKSRSVTRNKPVRYFVDPSIAVAALNLNPDELLKNSEQFERLFKNLCIRDLRIYAQALDGEVYHFKDRNDLICDGVIKLNDGTYGLINICLDDDEIDNKAKELLKLKKKIDTQKVGEPKFLMVLTGITPCAYIRADGVYVVPIGGLKP